MTVLKLQAALAWSVMNEAPGRLTTTPGGITPLRMTGDVARSRAAPTPP
jgi:hypothetical protein